MKKYKQPKVGQRWWRVGMASTAIVAVCHATGYSGQPPEGDKLDPDAMGALANG